jgi:predicted PurR-regulated permease PerM
MRAFPAEPVLEARAGLSRGTRVLAFAAIIALLYFGRLFFVTLLIGVICALLLEPAVRVLARLRIPRSIGAAAVCSVALLGLYYSGLIIYEQVVSFADEMPAYSKRLDNLVQKASDQATQFENRVKSLWPKKKAPPPPPPPVTRRGRTPAPSPVLPPAIQEVRVVKEETPFLVVIWNFIQAQSETLLMVSFVPFLAYFILVWQDHMIRNLSCFFREPNRIAVRKSWKEVAQIARIYTMGNVLLGVVLAAASAVTFYSFGLPYAFLTGILSGFLSLLPYVGLPLAMIPPFVPALMKYEDPGTFLLIAGLVASYHLVALNLLYPKIVGASLHLNPLAVTIALMFWATLWGPMGFLLGIPVTAGIKAVCDSVEALQDYGRILGDSR